MIDISDKLAIGSFLNFGYDVTYSPDMSFEFPALLDTSTTPNYKVSKDIFMSCVERSIGASKDNIVIPISGGLDSRALLAAALEIVSADRIKTYTFGSKSSYDFEIGIGISKTLGVECTSYELSEYGFDERSLYTTAEMFDYQTTLFYHPPYEKITQQYSSDLCLIGFMGDPLAGSHLPHQLSVSDAEVFENFAKKNQMVKSCSVFSLEPSQLTSAINFPENISDVITKDEYLDFQLRQLKYVYPHVMPRGLNCQSPFIQKEWFIHMLSLPSEHRLDQRYYNEFLCHAFPLAFAYRCKNNFGLPLATNPTLVKWWQRLHRISWLKNKTVNYQNFNHRIKEDVQLYKLLEKLLNDLQQRDLGLNLAPLSLLQEHKNGNPKYADAIINMASLEVNLASASNANN